jgi:uncharacterized protein
VKELALGLLVGGAVGAVMARGAVCFNAGVRHAVFRGDRHVLRVFGLAVAVQLLVYPLLLAAGVDPLRAAIDGGQPPLLPVAQIVGGLVFGVGMALAGGCIAGILWKSGAGSVATAIAVIGFAGGELLARDPLAGLLERLDEAGSVSDPGLHALVEARFEVVALIVGAVALAFLLRLSRSVLAVGVVLGLLASAAWLAADATDYGYGLGFTGTAANVRFAIESRSLEALSLEPFLALGLVLGAALAVRGPLRLPDAARGLRAGAGGVLMGLGANVAHGCNIGHGLTGLALLSLGSALATVSMAAGVILAWRFLLRPWPRLRGMERPEAVGW